MDEQTRRIIAEKLCQISETKDELLYGLMIDGRLSYNNEMPSYQQTKQKTNENQFQRICRKQNCRFNENSICKSDAVNIYKRECNESNNYRQWEEK